MVGDWFLLTCKVSAILVWVVLRQLTNKWCLKESNARTNTLIQLSKNHLSNHWSIATEIIQNKSQWGST